MKPTKHRLIVFDDGLQCALPDFIGDLIDELEVLKNSFALSFGQRLDRSFHRTEKIRGLGRPIDCLQKMNGPSAKISLQVRWLHAPKETGQAKAHGLTHVPHLRSHML